MNIATFGFRNVTSALKSTLVAGVFNRVSHLYDLMNDLMSFGLHRLWKRYFVKLLHPSMGENILDVAGGTGDIPLLISERVQYEDNRAMGTITLLDINPSMIHIARSKVRSKLSGVRHPIPIEFVIGDGENLPFTSSFDGYTIAFGIRNFNSIRKGFEEGYRVLRSGGRVFCLEFSHVNNWFLRFLYNIYSFYIIPIIGYIVVGDSSPYNYLVESISRFPKKEEIKLIMEEVGFKNVGFETLCFGVVAIHWGLK